MRTNIRQKYWREISNMSNNAETYRNIREKYSIEIFYRNILQKYSRELKKKVIVVYTEFLITIQVQEIS